MKAARMLSYQSASACRARRRRSLLAASSSFLWIDAICTVKWSVVHGTLNGSFSKLLSIELCFDLFNIVSNVRMPSFPRRPWW